MLDIFDVIQIVSQDEVRVVLPSRNTPFVIHTDDGTAFAVALEMYFGNAVYDEVTQVDIQMPVYDNK